ncbi:putative mitochondrial protein, partial [Mucuna pruriens]
MMGELKFFLGLQIKKIDEGILINQSIYSDKKVDQATYHGMIGSLLYLTISRPNLMFNVFLCARFQSDHRESHLTIVKRIVRYIKDTTNLGLLFKKSNKYRLASLCYGVYARDKLERKSLDISNQILTKPPHKPLNTSPNTNQSEILSNIPIFKIVQKSPSDPLISI